MQWDVFVRVIDNYGDVGVCWRLACGLAARGVTPEHLPRLVPLAVADFAGQTNPIKATAADYERLFREAM